VCVGGLTKCQGMGKWEGEDWREGCVEEASQSYKRCGQKIPCNCSESSDVKEHKKHNIRCLNNINTDYLEVQQ
jgi:hypothetical protein